MKLVFSTTILLVAIVCIPACESYDNQSTHVAIDTVGIKKSLDSLGAVVQRAHDTRDNALMASAWAKDGVLCIAGAPPVKGRDAIVNAIASMPPLPPGGKMTIHPIEVQVLSSDWAYILGIDSLKYTPSGTTEPVSETSTFFVLIRKTSEGWQTYRETLTPNHTPRNKQK